MAARNGCDPHKKTRPHLQKTKAWSNVPTQHTWTSPESPPLGHAQEPWRVTKPDARTLKRMNRVLLVLELEAYLWLAPWWKGNCSGVARSANCRSRPAKKKCKPQTCNYQCRDQIGRYFGEVIDFIYECDCHLHHCRIKSLPSFTLLCIIHRVLKITNVKICSLKLRQFQLHPDFLRDNPLTCQTSPTPEGTSVRWYAAAATASAKSDSRAQRASGTGSTEGMPWKLLLPKIYTSG